MGGMNEGEVALVLAESGKGKSTLLDNWALSNALEWANTLPEATTYLFLLEQTSRERLKRMAQLYYGLTRTQLSKRSEVELPPCNLVIVDEEDLPQNSIDGIDDWLRRQVEEYGARPESVFIDYPANMDSLITAEHQELKAAAKQMERLAIRYRAAFVFGNQASVSENFDYEIGHLLDHRNIAGAKALRNSCRLCLSINRTKDQMSNRLCTINVFKNTRGRPQTFEAYMDLSTYRIQDLEEGG